MIPRLPTLYASQRALDAMAQQRSALTATQLQLSTGKRVNDPSDDPLAAAQAERIRAQLARIAIEQRMTGFARHMLSTAENTLGQVSDSIQFARESLVSAGNGALAPADRALVAQQLRGIRDQLVTQANQRDGAGGYVFGGQGTTLPPFDPVTGVPVDPTAPGAPGTHPGERQTGLDVRYSTSQNGREVFVGSDGTTLFEALDTAIGWLENASASGTDITNALAQTSKRLDVTLERVLMARTRAGEQLRALEAHENALGSGELDVRGRLSDLVDLDFAAAISSFQNEQTGLSAAMQTYAQIARMSLFDYLR